jgi:hypothetical protein
LRTTLQRRRSASAAAQGTFRTSTDRDSFERCREAVAVYSRPDFKSELHSGPSAFAHATDFVTALQQIGYSTEYARTLVAAPKPDAYWDFVSRLWFRGPVSDRDEFVRRVMAMR